MSKTDKDLQTKPLWYSIAWKNFTQMTPIYFCCLLFQNISDNSCQCIKLQSMTFLLEDNDTYAN